MQDSSSTQKQASETDQRDRMRNGWQRKSSCYCSEREPVESPPCESILSTPVSSEYRYKGGELELTCGSQIEANAPDPQQGLYRG